MLKEEKEEEKGRGFGREGEGSMGQLVNRSTAQQYRSTLQNQTHERKRTNACFPYSLDQDCRFLYLISDAARIPRKPCGEASCCRGSK